jgi:hypothetical protein
MIEQYFSKTSCEEFFAHRNFKYETIFHVAAKYNSINSMKALMRKAIF